MCCVMSVSECRWGGVGGGYAPPRFCCADYAHLQQPLQVLALRIAGNRIGVGQIVAGAAAVPAAARRLRVAVLVHVAPVLELLFVVLQQHQRRKQAVAAAASVLVGVGGGNGIELIEGKPNNANM